MDTITAIIETPKGSSEKYNYDPETKFFKLKKILPSGMVFPFDFGFIPDTKGQDGDPLDVIVLSEFHSFPGCVVECRIIGAITAEQSEKKKKIRNDRFLAIPEQGKIFKKVNSIEDLPRQIMDELEQFFKNYNEIEGKIFQPLERLNAKEAAKLLKQNKNGKYNK
jgi:inorganic pyrophosphatase